MATSSRDRGKPPDFVLEVASPGTAEIDVVDKRDDYAALGIPEYWRFDRTGEHHGARLAGDRLLDGVYVPMRIDELQEGVLQGYSVALNLYMRWEHGQLGWYDPAAGQHIPTYDDQLARAESERAARTRAEDRAEVAEDRVRELESEIRRLHDA